MEDKHAAQGLRTLEDINALILHSHDLQETLDNIVTIVARRMGTDVCSIYLLEGDGETIRLAATKGLSKASVGKITMKTSEGLTGLAIEQRGVVNIRNAPDHPRYKYFRETKEERYHSFLGIPLLERKTPVGVIVVQTRDPRSFTQAEISTLATIAYQISSIVINAKLLDSIRKNGTTQFLEQGTIDLASGSATIETALDEPGELVLDVILADDNRTMMVNFMMADEDVEFLLPQPESIIGADDWSTTPGGPTGGVALGGKTTRSFGVTGGTCGVPTGAVAISLNVTAVGAAAAGYLTVYPGNWVGAPAVSSVNFSAGQTRGNNAIAPLSTDGKMSVECGPCLLTRITRDAGLPPLY